jgi:hypothetical protein
MTHLITAISSFILSGAFITFNLRTKHFYKHEYEYEYVYSDNVELWCDLDF